MINLNVDLEKYIVYRDCVDSKFVGVDMKYQQRMIDLYREYKGFKKVPENEEVECYLLVPDLKGAWQLDLSTKMNCKINNLEGTIISIMAGYMTDEKIESIVKKLIE